MAHLRDYAQVLKELLDLDGKIGQYAGPIADEFGDSVILQTASIKDHKLIFTHQIVDGKVAVYLLIHDEDEPLKLKTNLIESLAESEGRIAILVKE